MTVNKWYGGKRFSFILLLLLAALIILTALLAPWLSPYDPYEAVLTDALKAPGANHWFGTDKMGRDLLSRVIWGGRASLGAAFALVACVFFIGSILGTVSGYLGGAADAVIMRLADMMVSFPGMVLAIAVAGILGASVVNAVIAVTLVSWPKYARLARSLVLKVKGCDYMTAARVIGSKQGHILIRYLFPLVTPTLVVTAATDIGGMMLELAGLSFLGFGAQPPAAEWGLMLGEGRSYMQSAPWLMIFPGLAIFLVVMVFNLLGDGLRDMVDPRSY